MCSKPAVGVVELRTTTFAKIGAMRPGPERSPSPSLATGSGWEIRSKGISVKFVVIPQPAYISPTVAGVVKGSPNPKGANVLLNWLISEKVLTYRAERFGNTPMNRDVKVGDQAKDKVLVGDQLTSLVKLDYEKVLAHRAGMERAVRA